MILNRDALYIKEAHMSKGQEILKKLLEDDNIEAFSSKESLKNALKENGLTEDEAESALAGIDDFPLDDDDLDTITGGLGTFRPNIESGDADVMKDFRDYRKKHSGGTNE